MNDIESSIATAQELVILARQRGLDLASACHAGAFFSPDRYISLWRKEGAVRYSLQGRINNIPERYKESSGSFTGMWCEVGELEDAEQALEFLKAWLLERKQVDDLPPRRVRSDGIG